ncbi:MAG: hypothetical protein GC145_06145 [Caulobacter sp.]|nr:hypothetical protein [Caulobacter sp.]
MLSTERVTPSVSDQVWANERETPAPRSAKPWYASEEKILRACWDGAGSHAEALELARSRLVERSPAAIYQRARRLGLIGGRPARARGRIRQIWEPLPLIDEAIRRAYQGQVGRKGAAAVGRDYGRPAWWVQRRAMQLGLSQPRGKEPPWSDAEIAILNDQEGGGPSMIKRALTKAGYRRTAAAIRVKMVRLKLSTAVDNPDVFSPPQLAVVFGVDPKAVSRWIEKGWLAAKAAGNGEARTHWKIHRKAARAFVFDHPEAVDLRKVEKFAFLDLIGGAG